MAVSQVQTGTLSVSTSAATQIGTSITTAGKYECQLELSAFALGDQFSFWVQSKTVAASSSMMVAGTFQQATYESVAAGGGLLVLTAPAGTIDSAHSVEFWVQRVSATTRSIPWSIRLLDGTVDANLVSAASGSLNRAAFAADTGLQTVRSNTAQAGAAGTITLDAAASAQTDAYKGCWIKITGGTGADQGARVITAYNGTTKVATIAPNWIVNPDNTSTFAIDNNAGVDVELIKNAVTVGTAGYVGIDWSKIAIAASVVDLSGTTVGACTAATVSLMGTGVLTSSAIAANAITASAIADNAIDRATFANDTGLKTVRSGTAQTGTSNTITLDAGASANNDAYKNALVKLTDNTASDQAPRLITAYNGTTKVATVSPNWTITPIASSTFAILNEGMLATTVSGPVDANLVTILGNAPTTTSPGILDVNVKNINSAAAATPGAAGGLLIAGSNAAATFANFTVSGTAALGAVTVSTVNASGTVTFNAFTVTNGLTVSGATTLTGAVAATNAGNDIRGITVGVNGITTTSMATDSLSAAAVSAAAVTKIQTGLATSTALGTVQTGVTQLLLDTAAILARIGGFAGTTTSTIFGWLRALGRSDLAAPADYNTGGGTYSPATDAQQALAAAAFNPTTTGVSIKTGGIVAASFGADSITSSAVAASAVTEISASVWNATDNPTRLLSAGTNIVLAKGTGLTGLNDLSQADVRTAVGLASADLDAQLMGLAVAIGQVPDDVWAVTDRQLTANGLDLIAVELGLNARQALSIAAASAAGKLSGAVPSGPTTIVIEAAGNPGTTRVSAAVDGVGNRTTVTLSPPA